MSSNGGVASIWLNSVLAAWGVVAVALNAVTLYSRVPRRGFPTSRNGTRKVITPVFLL